MSRLQAVSRRRLLQFLAGSPVLATGAGAAFAETLLPKARLPDPMVWAPLDPEHLIKSPRDAINVFDFEPVMRQNVPPAHFGYMASGIDDEVTLRANREGFLKFQLRPRRLVDVSKIDTTVEILGIKYDTRSSSRRSAARKRSTRKARSRSPKRQGQAITCRFWPPGRHRRSRRSSLRAVPRFGFSSMPPTSGRSPRRSCCAPRRRAVRSWPLRSIASPGVTRKLSCGCRVAIRGNVADATIGPASRQTSRLSSNMTWDFLKRLRDTIKMKIAIKGILAHEDAVLAADAGIDAIIVSNHGARGEDSGRSTIDALPEIIAAVGGRLPVLVDSGFRRGTDIVKALALGANAVCIGRPYVWGLGAFGQSGVERVLELLQIELRTAMQQVGAPTIKHLVPDMIRRA
jgi:4-hydroxymandelate oxidase